MNEPLSSLDLNLWLHEHLFGIKREENFVNYVDKMPNYSGNIQEAWRVWDKMRELGWLCVLKEIPNEHPFILEMDYTEDKKLFRRACAEFSWVSTNSLEDCRKKIHVRTFTAADTPSRAICEAAKKAIEQTK